MTSAKILIVPQDDSEAAFLEEKLKEFGYEVCAAPSRGRQAIEGPAAMEADLALVDLGVDGEPGGIEAGERIGARIPVIYLTDGAGPDLLRRAQATRPSGYVVKPVDGRQLHLNIQTALCRRDGAGEREEEAARELEELRDRCRLMESMFESISEGVVAIDEEGGYLVYNSKAREMFGPSMSELGLDQRSRGYGLYLADRETLFPDEELPLRRALAGESSNDVEIFVRNPRVPQGLLISVSARPIGRGESGIRGGLIVCRDVTGEQERKAELRQAVKELEHDNALLRSVLEQISDGVVLSDAMNHMIYANPSARRILGADLLDAPPTERSRAYGIFHPDRKTHVEADLLPLVRAVHGEETEETELFYRNETNPAGRHVRIKGRPLRSGASGVTGGMAILRDVTEYKELEARLREADGEAPDQAPSPEPVPAEGPAPGDEAAPSPEVAAFHEAEGRFQHRFRELRNHVQLIESACHTISDGVIVADPRGVVLFANATVERIFGRWIMDPEISDWSETFGVFHADVKTPVAVDQLPLARALAGEETGEMEYFIRNQKNKEGSYINARAYPVFNSDKSEIIAGVAVFQDITNEREMRRRLGRVRDELRDQTQLMETAFSTMWEGIVVTDREGQVLMVNPSAERIFGMEDQPVSPERWSETYGIHFLDKETPVPHTRLPLMRALLGETTEEGEEFFVRNDSRPEGVYISASARPLRDRQDEIIGAVGIVRDISIRKRSELELQESNRELRRQSGLMETIFENMDEGLAVCDPEGALLITNPRFEEILGMGKVDSGPEGWSEEYGAFEPGGDKLVPVDDLPLVRAMRGEQVTGMEVLVRNPQRPDGVYVSASAQPILESGEDKIQAAVAIFRDITSYKNTEAALERTVSELKQQLALTETVFDSISDGVVVADGEGNFIIFNPAAERIVGMGMMEAPPEQWTDTYGLFYLDQKTHIPTSEVPLVRAIGGQATDDMEMYVRNDKRPEGVYLNVSGRPLMGEQGLGGGVVVFQDISARKRSEAELERTMQEMRNQNELMETTFKSISDGLVVADEKGKFLYVNPAAEQISGMTAVDSPPENWAEDYGTFYPDRQTPMPPDELPLLRAIFRGESTDEVDLFLRNPARPDGVFIRVSGRPLLNEIGGIRGGVIAFRDVTEQMQAEEALARAFAQGRLEIVDTILHNIGNAINSVTTGIETVRQGVVDDHLLDRLCALADAVEAHRDDWAGYIADDPQGRKAMPFLIALARDFADRKEGLAQTVDRVRDRANHIADIVRTQRALGSPHMDRKDIDLRQSLSSAVRVLQDSLGRRGIKVGLDCEDAPAEVRIQESQFHQMMVNLIKNGFEAIDDLQASGELVEAPRIDIRAYKEGEFLHVDVTDNGIGIDKANPTLIFSAGYTTKEEGSGLGLHSAANFVIGSGGQIHPLSEGPGKGTTMRVMLRLSSVVPPRDQNGESD